MKREFRKRIEKSRDERIYELWKSDIRNTNVRDIALKVDDSFVSKMSNKLSPAVNRTFHSVGVRSDNIAKSLNETSYQSL